MNVEIALTIFTSLVQISMGLSLFLSFQQMATASGSDDFQREWLIVFILAFIGLSASILHLGKPMYAPFGMKNIGLSWLSREGVAITIFFTLSFLSYYTRTSALLTLATILSAVTFIIAQGFTYAATGLPAIDNIYPMIWFTLAAFAGGGSAFVWLSDEETMLDGLVPLCVVALLLSHIAFPATWLGSENILIQKTAENWLNNILYKAGVASLVLASILAIAKRLKIMVFLFTFAGIIMTRYVFFIGTVHYNSNIGNLY